MTRRRLTSPALDAAIAELRSAARRVSRSRPVEIRAEHVARDPGNALDFEDPLRRDTLFGPSGHAGFVHANGQSEINELDPVLPQPRFEIDGHNDG